MRWAEPALVASLLVSADVTAGDAYNRLFRLYDFPPQVQRDAVPVCFHHGCTSVARVAIDDEHWRQVSRHLQTDAGDPAGEREQIRQAIAEMERVTGVLAGTSGDRAGDLQGFGTIAPQMDCIDESANTTTYLTLFEQAGLLRWHSVEPRATRGYLFFGGWPHYTAIIREHRSGHLWAVDSWFRDNGNPPDVVELETWKDGWKPDSFTF